ncbi:MAG TPA: hypothetical protein VD816_11595 [Ohtaekwangia sp.]|nr:hypothetical protein [Ohtaekwangia sp.]
MDIFIEALGWIGSIAVVTAYGLNSYQKIKSDSISFYLMNIGGGALLIVYSYFKTAYANIFINIVWVVIAVTALIRLARKIKA